jgi:hypothetical protein
MESLFDIKKLLNIFYPSHTLTDSELILYRL